MKLSSPHTPYGPCLHLAQVKVSDIFFDHVNSQYRVSDSRSSSDFKIELQDTFEIPDNYHYASARGSYFRMHGIQSTRIIRTCILDIRYCHLPHLKE